MGSDKKARGTGKTSRVKTFDLSYYRSAIKTLMESNEEFAQANEGLRVQVSDLVGVRIQLESRVRDAEYAVGEGFDALPRVQALKAQIAMLGENYQGFLATGAEMNRLGKYFREHYAYEIESGQHARFPSAIDAAIFYMARERRRGGFWRRVRGLFRGRSGFVPPRYGGSGGEAGQ